MRGGEEKMEGRENDIKGREDLDDESLSCALQWRWRGGGGCEGKRRRELRDPSKENSFKPCMEETVITSYIHAYTKHFK